MKSRIKKQKSPQIIKSNCLKNKRRGSVTIESALVFPICIFVVLLIIRLGIMIYDTYTLAVTAQDWADSCLTAGDSDWARGLAAELNAAGGYYNGRKWKWPGYNGVYAAADDYG